MSALYTGIMFSTMKSPSVVWNIFTANWYFIVAIIGGFGIQVGLWILVRCHGAMAGVSGAAGGGAMLACCVHHIADLAPLLGLSAFAGLVSAYQRPLLVVSLIINLVGIGYMYMRYKKYLYGNNSETRSHTNFW